MSPDLFHTVVLYWTAVAPFTFVTLLFIAAPYGRHAWGGGPMLSARAGWMVMEVPAVVLMMAFFAIGTHQSDAASWAFLALFEAHYIHRAIIYPLRMKGKRKPMPLFTALGGSTFQVINVSLMGWWLFTLAPTYGTGWFADPRFLAGTAVFAIGFAINYRADTVLLNLRKPGETEYKIPFGGLYRFVSCPNYLGEIVEWAGFALATWSMPALAFALWTAANLVPRALTNHKWYRAQFPDYPPERRAVLPFAL